MSESKSFLLTVMEWRISRATLFGQLKIGQLNLANYLMQIRLDLEGLKI